MEITREGVWKKARSENYNYDFNLKTGYFARWGKTEEHDPIWSPFGPEILDIEISTRCSFACPFCSVAGTKINMGDGSIVNIEDVKAGDVVIGHNGIDNENQTVIETYERDYDGDMVIIELEDGSIMKYTGEHEFFLSDGTQILAKKLKSGDDLLEI